MTRAAICEKCNWPVRECECERNEERARARANDAARVSKRINGKPTGYQRALGSEEEPQIAVPCRRCGKPVEISQWVVAMASGWSAMLTKRGEEPLRQEELTLCSDCAVVNDEQRDHATDREFRERDERWRRSLEAGEIGRFDRDWLHRRGFHEDVRSLEEVLRKRKEAKPRRAAMSKEK